MPRTAHPSWSDLAAEDPLYERDEEEGEEEGERMENESESMDEQASPAPAQQGSWTMEQFPTEQRPGPQPLIGRRRNNALLSSSATSPADDTSTNRLSESSRIPAAGVGTRVGPRPVPKSSSSLRHISSKSRASSFGVPLHEDEDLGVGLAANGAYRTVQSSLDAAKRRQGKEMEREAFLEDDSDNSDRSDNDDTHSSLTYSGEATGWESDLYGSLTKRRASSSSAQGEKGGSNVFGHNSSGEEDDQGGREQETAVVDFTSHGEAEVGPSTTTESLLAKRYAAAEPGGFSLRVPRRAPWHPRGSAVQDGDSPPLLGSSSGLATPGPVFPQALHTPIGTPPDAEPVQTIEPRHRLEWHTMLQSVLRSEVLQSETKRITSADAPSMTKRELMYQRWLDIRASLRGRGHHQGAIEAEEKRLREGWPILLEQVMEAVRKCRLNPAAPPAEKMEVDIDESSKAVDDLSGTKERALEEVGQVLRQVDDAEEQFPSFRKLVEEVPAWNEEGLQRKLDGLYSWYNVTSSLRLQMRILQQWTGSQTLEIAGHQGTSRTEPDDGAPPTSKPGVSNMAPQADMEESTFLERILKEDSLQSTFEKRTLRALDQLTLKAKQAIIKHHAAFGEMALPSFEPELSQLINFPTRLMEGALKLRLDYAGKLKEPSVLIVDSLTDDLRAVIALACRIKLQYSKVMVPDPANGWDILPCIGKGYDPVLREALRFFFKLLNYKLQGSTFFKETEILEPEWRFLSTAVEAIEGGDVIVAISITRFVNRLFKRIVAYFERELSAPSTSRTSVDDMVKSMTSMSAPTKDLLPRGPSTAGGLTKGHVKMTLDEKVRWIHQVFNSVRIRSRKLLGFARDIRNRLENAAEYDLGSLSSTDGNEADDADKPDASDAAKKERMDLTQFLQTLIDAGYFLVLTGSFEAEGVYLIAEPSLSDKPELIQELFCKCLHRVKPSEEESAMAAQDNIFFTAAISGDLDKEEEKSDNGAETGVTGAGVMGSDDERPKYLLVLSPRDAFLWTGRVMSLELPRIDVDLKERRLRLIADGPNRRLHMCQMHLDSIFRAAAGNSQPDHHEAEPAEGTPLKSRTKTHATTAAAAVAATSVAAVPPETHSQVFPLEVVTERLAHISAVQSELRRINQGVYMLSDAIIRAVPKIRRNLRGRRAEQSQRHSTDSQSSEDKRRGIGTSGDCDELIQNCFGMASEQGYRALPFIESARLRDQMTLALATLAIDWVAFICDDCEPSDRKTFKWAVGALENAQHVTRAGGILNIGEDDFILMRSKVASCVGLLISHFDILGARSSVAKAKEEEERLEREKAERIKMLENAAHGEYSQAAAKVVQGSGTAGAPPMLGRADSGMQATEERWVGKVMEWDAARQSIEAEQRLIGRVLDDTRLEDRGLQFLASSSSRIQIRWQQGRFIGGGTFGTVYLAVNLDSGGLMAVKEIRFQDISSTPGVYKQIKDEMSVMEMLSHPNIVEYYGIEVHRDKVYIFEEYCQGGSLAQLLEHGRIEDEAVTQVYTLQMLDGLVYLHSKGVVHRDIKPDNILLDHMGVIKFVDFGAAKVLAKNSRTVQRSRRTGAATGGAMPGMLGADGKPAGGLAASLQGTPMYMSPEVIKGESRGRRGAMDVWSLGCVVLEFATGRRPWSQLDNEWAIMFHIGMAQQHPPLPEPGQLSDLGIEFIRSCLIIDPYDRPSAIELREHAWIQNLIEELNRANEDEGLQDAMSQSQGSSDVTQAFVHGTDSAAGVAAMAATPGTRSINGFNFGRQPGSSFGANSSFSRHSNDSFATTLSNPPSHINTPVTAPSSGMMPAFKTTIETSEGEADLPTHEETGTEALVADVVKQEEDREKELPPVPLAPDTT